MSGYVWRGVRSCSHVGGIYDPGRVETCTVACPSCHAKSCQPCVEGHHKRVVDPHARRYIAHHEANCTEKASR